MFLICLFFIFNLTLNSLSTKNRMPPAQERIAINADKIITIISLEYYLFLYKTNMKINNCNT